MELTNDSFRGIIDFGSTALGLLLGNWPTSKGAKKKENATAC